jgi:exonuclease VII small subunit
MAAAHEAAAKCLESGKKVPDQCQKELQAACKGLAIGKYCGMKHEH